MLFLFSFPFLQMEWHLSNKCPMIEVICPYAKAGCPFQVWTEHNVINCCIPCGMKFSWDLIFANFTDFKSRKNKLPPKKFRENLLLLFTLLNFNEIGGKQCKKNDHMPSVFVTFKNHTWNQRERIPTSKVWNPNSRKYVPAKLENFKICEFKLPRKVHATR